MFRRNLFAFALMSAAWGGCVGEILDAPFRPSVARDASTDTATADGDSASGDTDTTDTGVDGAVEGGVDSGRPDVPIDDACAPTDETCNGRDDDCDGRVDEVLEQTCGTDIGACELGVVVCTDGAFPACTPAVVESAETCDGTDQDCDGSIDEGIAPVACGSAVGACMPGTQACVDGALGPCTGLTGPVAEVCNGRDDNCDGTNDNGIAPRACGNGTGECRRGTQTCSGGSYGACTGGRGPVAEVCNGRDDNCDGTNDNGIPRRACGSNVGWCRRGTQACAGGSYGACTGGRGPRAELDNGIDDDCNGVVDNGIPCESAIERQQRLATNAERTSRGLGALSCDRGLRRAARKYAQVICDIEMNPLSHTGPGGTTIRSRIDAEGVVWTLIGENLAFGFATPASVTSGWMGSPPHRANILNGGFGRVGVGYVACGGPPYQHVWVQNFAN